MALIALVALIAGARAANLGLMKVGSMARGKGASRSQSDEERQVRIGFGCGLN